MKAGTLTVPVSSFGSSQLRQLPVSGFGGLHIFPLFPSPRLTEADLAHLWEGQRFPAEALRTTRGAPLRAVYRGRRTGGPGPDYRDAVISAPGELLQGDVELHVRSSDFRRHGHHLDAAYDGLALHLVFRHDDEDDTLLACGRRVPVVALAEWAEGRAREIEGWLARPEAWSEPCRSAVARLGADACAAALDRLGLMRFRAKAAQFRKRLESLGSDQALWEGICEALGYGGCRDVLSAVAAREPWAAVRERMSRAPARSRGAAAEAVLLDALETEQEAGLGRPARPSSPLRPRNRPQARLRGAAALAARFGGRGPWGSLEPAVAAKDSRALLETLTVKGSIGRGRAIEIAANAILPCASAAGLEGEAEWMLARMPLAARYGAVRHIHEALGGAVRANTIQQQGMLYLLREYCSRGGCGRCVLS